MPTLPRLLLLLTLLTPALSHAASLYLCKSYSGGMFWSSGPCSEQKATIERIVSVPDGMPFAQQVQLGEQAVAEAARLAAPRAPTTSYSPPADRPAARAQGVDECKWLDEQIRQLDALARQPQSAATQDMIAQKRRAARDRQFRIPCR